MHRHEHIIITVIPFTANIPPAVTTTTTNQSIKISYKASANI